MRITNEQVFKFLINSCVFQANNMILNGARLTAHEAKMRGFVTEIFPHDTLKRNATAQIENCAKKSPEVCSFL